MYKLFHCIFLPASAGSGSVLVRQFPHLQQSWRTERHKLKEAAHWAVQPMPQATWASTWQTYNFQFATEACFQPPAKRAAVPLVAQDVISAPASQALVGRLFQFVVCWLNALSHNRMEVFVHEEVAKSQLWWTEWHAAECTLAGFDYFN